jgi:hypothetical protein
VALTRSIDTGRTLKDWMRTFRRFLPDAKDHDWDGKPVHVCEVGDDGCLYIAAGPHFMFEGGMVGMIEFVAVDRDGLHKHTHASMECGFLQKFGHRRRMEILRRALAASRRMWERREAIDLSAISHAVPYIHPATNEDLRNGILPHCGYHVEELERYLTDATRNPASLMTAVGQSRPETFGRIRNRLNDLLTTGNQTFMARRGIRTRPWLAYCSLEALHDHMISKARILELDVRGVAKLMTTYLDHPGWIVSPWIVGWMDKRAADVVPVPDAWMLVVLDALPRSWLPRDSREMESFMRIAERIIPIFRNVDETVALLRASKGRFDELWHRMQRDVGPDRDLGGALHDIRDFLVAVCADLMDVPMGIRLPLEIEREASPHLILARRLVTPDGGIRHLLHLSERWHRIAYPAVEEIAAATDATSWQRSVPDFTSSAGCRVIELLTEGDLDEEGRNQGHCVGGYARNCAWGGSHIFSIRSGPRTLSTFEVRFGNADDPAAPKVLQHQGPNRIVPKPLALAALAEWLDAIAEGRSTPVPRKVDPAKMGAAIPTRAPMSLDQWRPFLAKPMGDLSEEDFKNEAKAMLKIEIRNQHPKA